MAKVDQGKFGPKYPGLDIALTTADATVVKIRRFEDAQIRGRTTRVVEFSQAPGQFLYLDQEAIKTLCAKLGDDDDKWFGAEVPIVKELVPSKRQGGIMVKVWKLASLAEWDSLMDQKARAENSGRRAPARTR